eukprot:2418553-Amphidinium_carterae.1
MQEERAERVSGNVAELEAHPSPNAHEMVFMVQQQVHIHNWKIWSDVFTSAEATLPGMVPTKAATVILHTKE